MSEVQLNTIETLDRQPFKHLVATIGNLPTSFVDSMSYYECIAWLVKYLETKVIPAIDNNAEALEELQAKYIELKDYVDNYFDNLDVQDEINNKLDEMAESGQLTELITEYLNVKSQLCFNSVAEMKSSDNLVDGSFAKTYGYFGYNDGGGALYKIRPVTTEDIVDESYIVSITSTLIAELVLPEYVTPEMFGAKGDGITDDNIALTKCLSSQRKILLYGTYYNSAKITASNVIICGGKGKITGYGISLSGESEVKDITFEDIQESAIEITGGKSIIDNCNFNRIGIKEDLVPNYSGCGIFSTTTGNNENELTVTNCLFKNCHSHGALYTFNNNKILFDNNTFIDNFYRAINIYANIHETHVTRGTISNNFISGCGRINTTNSGVGCNGIMATCGTQVDCINNKITDCFENGIEGRYKTIIGNFISYTNNDMTSHPTPSVEGIYLANGADVIVKNNTLVHVKKYGISASNVGANYTNTWIIANNNISVDSYNGTAHAIHFDDPGSGYHMEKLQVRDNVTTNLMFIPRGDKTCVYSGDISLLTLSSASMNVIDVYNNFYSYEKIFDNLDGWTYGACSPTIVADSTINNNVVHWAYQEYNRVVAPQLPYCTRMALKLRFYAKGNFNINVYKGNTWYNTIGTFSSDTYTANEINASISSNNTEKLYIRFEATSGNSADIQSVSMKAHYC